MHHRTQRNPARQLGNTGMRPSLPRLLWARALGAPSDGSRSSIAIPNGSGSTSLSRHSRPDRRGHIRPITGRLWLLRSSPCCSCCPALRFGRPRRRGPGQQPFHVLHSTPEGLGPLSTPAVCGCAPGDVRAPGPDCIPFWFKPASLVWLVCVNGACERSLCLTISSNSSPTPD